MDPLFLVAVVLAELVGTVAGFGSSTVLLPVALLFFDFGNALVLVAVVHIAGNLAKSGWFRREIDNHLFLNFGVASVIASMVGAKLVTLVPSESLKMLLGLFLIVYAAVDWSKRRLKIARKGRWLVLGGGLSGFLAGLIGTGGALRGAFLAAVGLEKERYIGTMAIIAVLVDVVRLPVYLREGLLSRQLVIWLPVLVVLAVLGAYWGRLIVKRVPQEQFRRVVLVALFAVGVKFLLGR